MAVAPQTLFLAPHHHDQFGVRLEAEYAVHDVRAGFLQLGREFNIGFFVEARAQLDDDGDVLAGCRCVDQRADNGGVAADAIQGLFDGEHLGIACCLSDEIGHRRESLKWVVQQHIAGAQGGEQIAARLQPVGNARRECRVLQFGAIHQIVYRHQAIHVHGSGHFV